MVWFHKVVLVWDLLVFCQHFRDKVCFLSWLGIILTLLLILGARVHCLKNEPEFFRFKINSNTFLRPKKYPWNTSFTADLINKTITAIKVKYKTGGFWFKKRQGRIAFIRSRNESLVWEPSAQAKWSPDEGKSIWISSSVITLLMVMKEPYESKSWTFRSLQLELNLGTCSITHSKNEGFDRRWTWHWKRRKTIFLNYRSSLLSSCQGDIYYL